MVLENVYKNDLLYRLQAGHQLENGHNIMALKTFTKSLFFGGAPEKLADEGHGIAVTAKSIAFMTSRRFFSMFEPDQHAAGAALIMIGQHFPAKAIFGQVMFICHYPSRACEIAPETAYIIYIT
jgi:hypothetical protein